MSIDQCPEEINQHEAFGHWEIDTVLLTLTERQTRFEIIRLIPDKTSASVNRALLALQEKIQFKYLTSDNGRKFARPHEAVTCPVYYCHAYASFERGSNENHNRMIRRFLPKGTKQTTVQVVAKIKTWMNRYPRKMFKYQTPFQMIRVAKLNLQFAKYNQ